ncbi:MAG: hypothetical protein ACFFBP_08730 [Promethearchaeota archaeon]
MNVAEYDFDYNNRYDVDGKPKLCWTCLKKFEQGIMVWSKQKMRRIFFCKDCLEKVSK